MWEQELARGAKDQGRWCGSSEPSRQKRCLGISPQTGGSRFRRMAARDEESESSRAETDKSLADERKKTDSHLERRHREVERETTEAIATDRRMADETRARDRAAHDRHVTDDHARTAKGDKFVVMAEREQSDNAISKERELEDSNLRRERREKQLLVEALLSSERQRTDNDLCHERECVDRRLTVCDAAFRGRAGASS